MKIGIIGLGNVGSGIAFSILHNENIKFDRLILNDIVDKVYGIRLDLCHAFPEIGNKIIVGGYDELNNCDVVIITAGIAMITGSEQFDRMDLLKENSEIFKKIFEKFKPKKDAILIIVSNPSDVMAYIAWKLSGLNSSQVIGFGNQVDTARFRFILGEKLGIDAGKIEAYVIGEHGNGMIPVFSQTNVGKDLEQSMKDEITSQLVNAAAEIIRLAGYTQYGPGQNVSKLVEAIVNDKKEILCVSTLLNGQYGVENLYMGTPCVIGRNGVEKIIELNLDENERKQFSSLVEKMRKFQKL
ncbi:MAG: L-lactate dehydrogenase [Candidatus Aenigmatarchaeota archaeon]|nr:L-lactate dehydrogenase [Candidatus Aenigmarchaeota archaeon]